MKQNRGGLVRQIVCVAYIFLMSTLVHASVVKAHWGKTTAGQPVAIYTLTDADLSVRITTYGARVVSIDAPDRSGAMADVVLGYKTLRDYENDKKTYFGAIVGRYANRIADGTFSLDGKTYHIPLNDGPNALHGGTTGFDQRVWQAKQLPDGVEMTLVSPNGQMGFPGRLTVHVRYTLKGRSLRLHYSATTTAPTVLNLANHSYFNLGGQASGTILNDVLMINADHYTPVNATLIPTGKIVSVAGTPFDFRKPTPIGARIDEKNQQLKFAGGYDMNFVLNGTSGEQPRLAARVVDPKSGRTLTVTTDQPGLQFYSGNFLNGSNVGVTGVKYQKYAGLAVETQHYPDSPNHPSFPSTVLKPGQTFHSTTVFTFGVKK